MSTGPRTPNPRVPAASSRTPDDIRPVLAAYPSSLSPLGITYLDGAGGFSGARLWKLATARGTLCLRRWPMEHPTPDQLTWIHSVLRAAATNGFRRLPVPWLTTSQATWVRHENALWEMTSWLPGKADYASHPSPARLAAALRALAEFHRSVEGVDGPVSAPSPGIERRVHQLERLLRGEFATLAAAVSSASPRRSSPPSAPR